MADKQLLYDNELITTVLSVTMPRGDTRQLVFSHLVYAEVISEAKLVLREPSATDDGTVWLERTLADHADQWNLDTAGQGVFTFVAADTYYMPIGVYQGAIEFVLVSGETYTPIKFNFGVEWDGVNDSDDVGYPSWATLGAMQSQLEALLAVCKATLVTIAAEAGDGALTVADASLFDIGDDIYVQASGAAYEAHEVESISGNEITLVGTLAAGVAVGKVVQLGVGA